MSRGAGGAPGTEDVREEQRKWEFNENNRDEPPLPTQYCLEQQPQLSRGSSGAVLFLRGCSPVTTAPSVRKHGEKLHAELLGQKSRGRGTYSVFV